MDGSLGAVGMVAARPDIRGRIVPHAFHHVGGVSKRVKAESVHIDRLAATIMAASGAFTGDVERGGGSRARGLGAIALAVLVLAIVALGIALGGTTGSPEESRKAAAATIPILPDGFYALGMGDYRADGIADFGELDHLSPQDRFEIARFHRLYEAARAKQEVERAAAARAAPRRRAQ